MSKANSPPEPMYAIGQTVNVLDRGRGTVILHSGGEEAGERYDGMSYTPVLYHVQLDGSSEVVIRSGTMIAPLPKEAPEPAAPEPVPDPKRIAETRYLSILSAWKCASDTALLRARGAGDEGIQASMANLLKNILDGLAPHDHAIVQGLIRAHETVLAHLESLKKERT